MLQQSSERGWDAVRQRERAIRDDLTRCA